MNGTTLIATKAIWGPFSRLILLLRSRTRDTAGRQPCVDTTPSAFDHDLATATSPVPVTRSQPVLAPILTMLLTVTSRHAHTDVSCDRSSRSTTHAKLYRLVLVGGAIGERKYSVVEGPTTPTSASAFPKSASGIRALHALVQHKLYG